MPGRKSWPCGWPWAPGGAGGGEQSQFRLRDLVGEDLVGQRLSKVGCQPLTVAQRQFVHVEIELLHQRQDHRRGYRAVIVFHLVGIGQAYAKALGEILLRKSQPLADFPQFRPGVEFLCCHAGHPFCKPAKLSRKVANPASPERRRAQPLVVIWRSRSMT